MAVRDQNLDAVAPVLATFKIKQTVGGVDDLTDALIGKPVTISASNEVGLVANGGLVLGKLISLTLTDKDPGKRLATVQVGGVCRLPISATLPVVGNAIVGGASNTVKQAPALAGNDPAGGNIARGTVLAVNGSVDCVVLL